MERSGFSGRRIAVICAGVLTLALGAVIAVRLLTADHAAGQPAAGTSPPASLRLVKSVTDDSPVEAVAFSPDGKLLAVKLASGVVQLRDARSGTVLASFHLGRMPADAEVTGALAFSPAGTTMAVGIPVDIGFHSKVELWDVTSRKLAATVPVNSSWVYSVAFSPDGKTLAVGGGRVLVLWNLAARASLTIATDTSDYRGDSVDVSFGADGKTLAVANDEGFIKLWDVSSARFAKTFTLPVPSYPGLRGKDLGLNVASASMSSGGSVVAAAGSIYPLSDDLYEAPTAWLWHTRTGKLDILRGGAPRKDGGGFECEALSPSGGLLATGDDAGKLQLWNTATGTAVATSSAHADVIALSPDGKAIAVAATRYYKGSFYTSTGIGTIQFWNVSGSTAG